MTYFPPPPSPDAMLTSGIQSAGCPLITSLVLFITGSMIIDPQDSFEVLCQFEHSMDWVESLVRGVHYWLIASLTALQFEHSCDSTMQSNNV